jgi:hypothetical protein
VFADLENRACDHHARVRRNLGADGGAFGRRLRKTGAGGGDFGNDGREDVAAITRPGGTNLKNDEHHKQSSLVKKKLSPGARWE